jgi:hypothetical protein
MSQVDFVNYIPLLIWSIISFLIFYCLIFMYILPLFFNSLKVRAFFYQDLLKNFNGYNLFIEFLVWVFKNNLNSFAI